jgi:hypothetical protein
MFFVLAIVMYRAVKGHRGEEQHEYSQITIIEEIVDNSNTSPPSYRDEKVPIVDETVQAPKSSPLVLHQRELSYPGRIRQCSNRRVQIALQLSSFFLKNPFYHPFFQPLRFLCVNT